MQTVNIEVQKVDDRMVITMIIGNVSAVYKRAGDASYLKAQGRGNVRQVKALLREFVRNSEPALI
ncbi:hypothetical protein [Xenorhabdus bovienii]|uniref:hypothetical protein n=1 Tax=Xenorhabdus bovienii TaxID=40576 RepID=UPI0004D61B41|nr:hypothetical protein [Xenorhabdus bovienii]CDG86511.1 conserved hypothetical protein [Xenorhabdus bovienii str. feltiae France]CDG92088.1 conserved hypothetical protein [Xenorhabdus bovienii str. feltiae Florida]